MGMENGDGRLKRGHVILVPYPAQGHINPMLQFAKRLASHGPLATLAVPRSVLTTAADDQQRSLCQVSIALISDGFDDGGFAKASSIPDYLDRLKSVGSETLASLIEAQRAEGRPVDVIVYDAFLPWALQAADWMESTTSMKPIGPTVPSSYLDNRLPTDTHYGFNLFTPTIGPCMTWLDSKPTGSVVYVSFGSMVCLSEEQMCELAGALRDCDKSFLWVVRATETIKLPHGFFDHQPLDDRGLVIPWGPQLEVLAHAAVGCFVTHCGWNSTIEGLCLGVPMIGVPQWSDQQTNAKYVEDVWRVGVRARADERGVVKRGEFLKCIGDVTGGKKGEETRENARKWREMAKAAVSEGGSSDKNILEFIEKFC